MDRILDEPASWDQLSKPRCLHDSKVFNLPSSEKSTKRHFLQINFLAQYGAVFLPVHKRSAARKPKYLTMIPVHNHRPTRRARSLARRPPRSETTKTNMQTRGKSSMTSESSRGSIANIMQQKNCRVNSDKWLHLVIGKVCTAQHTFPTPRLAFSGAIGQ